MRPKGVIVIGEFRPVNLPDIAEALNAHDSIMGRLSTAWHVLFGSSSKGSDIRFPLANVNHGPHQIGDKSAERWHHDCGGITGSTASILFWSNKIPIEFTRDNGKHIWAPEPWEVVCFDNTDPALKHRRPSRIDIGHQRWSIVDRRAESFRVTKGVFVR